MTIKIQIISDTWLAINFQFLIFYYISYHHQSCYSLAILPPICILHAFYILFKVVYAFYLYILLIAMEVPGKKIVFVWILWDHYPFLLVLIVKLRFSHYLNIFVRILFIGCVYWRKWNCIHLNEIWFFIPGSVHKFQSAKK